MEFVGKVYKVLPATSGTSARGAWQRQEVVFDIEEKGLQYPRKICVTFFNKPEDVSRLQQGVSYKVSIDVESREYKERWYTDVRAWRIEPQQAEQPQPMAEPPVEYAPMPTAEPQYATVQQGDIDDLPF